MTGDTVVALSGALRRFFVSERVARRGGFLQRRDPRAAVAGVFALALAAVLARRFAVLGILAGLTALLAWRSRVPARRLLARATLVPAASALTVLPQAALRPGDALLRVGGVAFTDAGLSYVALFALRTGVGVALLSVLVLTTPFSAVVGALRSLRVPVAVVWVAALTYRYVFLFFDELRRLALARASRSVGGGDWRDARRLAGTFLLRVLDRGERVGRGMRARGGARPPSPYARTGRLDAGDALLLGVAGLALAVSAVVRWT